MTEQLALGPDTSSPGDARLFVTHWTRTWGYRALIPAAALLTSELATNAVIHAGRPFSVEVTNTGRGIHVAVNDPSSEPPSMREPSEVEARGRGLLVVDSVASTWGSEVGTDGTGGGKSVWFELDVGQPAAHIG